MTQRRCQNCREFYDKAEGICPSCGEEAYKFNVHLRISGLNSHLYNPPPDHSHAAAKKAAKEYFQ